MQEELTNYTDRQCWICGNSIDNKREYCFRCNKKWFSGKWLACDIEIKMNPLFVKMIDYNEMLGDLGGDDN